MHTDRFCNCYYEEGHAFSCPMAGNNKPGARVWAQIFRNAYIGDIDEHYDWVVLDRHGIHATWTHVDWFDLDGNPVVEELTRLNQTLSYSFDAPDTLCPIRTKLHHVWEIRYRDRALWKSLEEEQRVWEERYEKALKER